MATRKRRSTAPPPPGTTTSRPPRASTSPPPRRSGAPPPVRSHARVRRPLVLVVDDKEDNREMYLEYLAFVGFRVAGASDGEAAIAAARKLHPSVILMDLSLPGTSGWDATRILKQDPATRDILIVALTGHAQASHEREALEAGCDLFLAKPCLPSDIARHVVQLLDQALTRPGRST